MELLKIGQSHVKDSSEEHQSKKESKKSKAPKISSFSQLEKIVNPIDAQISEKIRNDILSSFVHWIFDNTEKLMNTKGEIVDVMAENAVDNKTLAQWVFKALRKVTKEDIEKSFENCGLLSKDSQNLILSKIISQTENTKKIIEKNNEENLEKMQDEPTGNEENSNNN